jgi:hypothetical protein
VPLAEALGKDADDLLGVRVIRVPVQDSSAASRELGVVDPVHGVWVIGG